MAVDPIWRTSGSSSSGTEAHPEVSGNARRVDDNRGRADPEVRGAIDVAQNANFQLTATPAREADFRTFRKLSALLPEVAENLRK